jgi:predicted ArsR family transcriptional regulator
VNGDDLSALAALQDPVRRVLYDYVVAQRREVGRGEAAEAAGVQRTLAAFHLDKLVEAGLLEAGSRRLSGRTGPGSGRPAKVYRRAAEEHQVSLPPRDYRTLALALAEVVETLDADDQAERAARRAGERLASAERRRRPSPVSAPGTEAHSVMGAEAGLEAVLEARGYEPYADGEGLRLRNCPFGVAAEAYPTLVCSMNLALCEGVVTGLEDDTAMAVLDPRPGECCVAFRRRVSKNNES